MTNALKASQHLPGPRGLPFLGNVLQLNLSRLHLDLERWADKYGAVYRIKLFNKDAIVLSDEATIQQVLKDRPDTYRRIRAIEDISRAHGTLGVLAAEGDEWRRQRAVVMQAFKPENIRNFFPILQETMLRLFDIWQKDAEHNNPVEIERQLMKLMVDITTRFAFGYDINLLQNEADDFQNHLEKQLPFFNRRVNSPIPYWRFFTLPADREANKSLEIIKETIKKFVAQTKKRLEDEPGLVQQPSNFLETLLVSEDEKGKKFTYTEIQGNIISILLAGEDTSAHTLSWLIYLLTEYPEVQQKMQQEADQVLNDDAIPYDIAAIDRLSYIEAALQETMRLKSVVPLLVLEANSDTQLDGMAIEKGTTLMLLTRYPGLQEKNFADANLFKPERWLESTPRPGCPHNRSASIPFGAGPRFCAARSLAMLKMKMAAAMLCKNFTVTRHPVGNQPVNEVFLFTLMPGNLAVKLAKRP